MLSDTLSVAVFDSVIRQEESGSIEFLTSFAFAASIYRDELENQPEGICAAVVIEIEQVGLWGGERGKGCMKAHTVALMLVPWP